MKISRVVSTVTAAVVGLSLMAGCGSDDDAVSAELSTEEFCSQLGELDEFGEADDDQSLESINAVIAVAPGEVRDDLEVLRDALVALEDVDEEDFGAVMEVIFQPDVLAAGAAMDEWGVDNCGFEPQDLFDIDMGDDSAVLDDDFDDAGFDDGDDGEDVGEVSAETQMPDDVTLELQDAVIITWTEVDEAFDYRIEIDGATVATTFGDRYVAVGHDSDDVVVEALAMGDESLGAVSDVSVDAGGALVVDWTAEPGGSYYVEYATTSTGVGSELADAPFTIPVPVDEVVGVRFGPGVVVAAGDGPLIDSPFDHGDDYWVELPLP